MDYTFLVRLPKNLETAYKAGKIIITDGVARDIVTGKIVAHLEQIKPFMNNSLNGFSSGNPAFGIYGMVLDTIKVGQGIYHIKQLNKIIQMAQTIQTLSCINIAMTGLNLGVSVAGFTIVLSKLNKIETQIQTIDKQIKEVIKSNIKDLIREISKIIKNSITIVKKLENTPISESTSHETEKLLNEIESWLLDLISRLENYDLVNVPHSLIMSLYQCYTILLKSYINALYLSNNLEKENILNRLIWLEKIKEKLTKKNIFNVVYEDNLINNSEKLSESDLDLILDLYSSECHQILMSVKNHHEIIFNTTIRQFKKWKNLQNNNNDSIIWVVH